VAADPYRDPATGVLYNRLGITDRKLLATAERKSTTVNCAELLGNSPAPTYDANHLKEIHRRPFFDIYPWAGEFRTVDIARSHLFCHAPYIEGYLEGLFCELALEHHLRGLPRAQFLERLAYYFSEVNAVHPFREGNGRTQRAFVCQLAQDAGHLLSWDGLDPAENIRASIESFQGNLEPLVALLSYHLVPEAPSPDAPAKP